MTGTNDRYSGPDATDGAGGPHPLADVPQVILDAARGALREAAELGDVDPSMADPIADAVVIDLLPWLDLRPLGDR